MTSENLTSEKKKKRRVSTKKKNSAVKRRRKAKSSKKPVWSVLSFKELEDWRERLGLSKSVMAEAIGVTNSTYHNWKRGVTVPHASQQEDILQRIKALETASANENLEGEDTPESNSGVPISDSDSSISEHQYRPSPTVGTAACKVPESDAGDPPSAGWTNPQAVATISAAWIAQQATPVSADDVVDFIERLRGVI